MQGGKLLFKQQEISNQSIFHNFYRISLNWFCKAVKFLSCCDLMENFLSVFPGIFSFPDVVQEKCLFCFLFWQWIGLQCVGLKAIFIWRKKQYSFMIDWESNFNKSFWWEINFGKYSKWISFYLNKEEGSTSTSSKHNVKKKEKYFHNNKIMNVVWIMKKSGKEGGSDNNDSIIKNP